MNERTYHSIALMRRTFMKRECYNIHGNVAAIAFMTHVHECCNMSMNVVVTLMHWGMNYSVTGTVTVQTHGLCELMKCLIHE